MPGKIFFLLAYILALSLPAIDEDEFSRRREAMVREQIQQRGIDDALVLKSFLKVKRHLFVLPQYLDEAYADYPLPIEEGQTISQPYIVALMTQVIDPRPSKRVLEIGTGSGYQAAILAELVKEVYSVEIKPRLAEKAKALLQKLGYQNIHVQAGDGYAGWKEHAPYDGIIVTCSPEKIPPPLIEQLAPGGKMVIPVESSFMAQDLELVEKTSQGALKKRKLIPVRFVPLIRENK